MNITEEINKALDYRSACTRLGLSLIPARRNEKMLSAVPYTAMEDLALIYKVEVGPSDAIVIDHEMLDGYGISAEELRRDALACMPRRHPCVIRSLAANLRDLMGDVCAGEDAAGSLPEWDACDEEKTGMMYTATTKDICRGACVIAYPGMLAGASARLGGDLFILPSSIHEVLLVKAEGVDGRHLQEIVREVNRTVVDERDWLSDNVYFYDAEKDRFMTAVTG